MKYIIPCFLIFCFSCSHTNNNQIPISTASGAITYTFQGKTYTVPLRRLSIDTLPAYNSKWVAYNMLFFDTATNYSVSVSIQNHRDSFSTIGNTGHNEYILVGDAGAIRSGNYPASSTSEGSGTGLTIVNDSTGILIQRAQIIFQSQHQNLYISNISRGYTTNCMENSSNCPLGDFVITSTAHSMSGDYSSYIYAYVKVYDQVGGSVIETPKVSDQKTINATFNITY